VSRLRAPWDALLEAALQIRPGEGRRTGLLFLHLFLASAVFFLGRTVRDTLFLSRYPLAALPWMFVAYGVASAGTVVLYARVADRMARHQLILLTSIVGMVTYLATWVVVRAGSSWIYPAFYVWADIVANLFIVEFWALANDLHDARAAKRLFGAIGSARLLASVVVGLGAGAVVREVGTAQLLFVLAALMAGFGAVAVPLCREPPAELGARAGAEPRHRGSPPRILRDPYVRALSVILLVAFTALNIGDYQFKAIARATYREDQLAQFFSLFYAGTGVVAFLFQIFVTPRILSRLGVGWGMATMPAVFGSAAAALLALPRLATATAMKFGDNGFQFTIQETTFQALYVPFAPEVKVRTRAFLEAVVKPIGYALAGLAVIAFVPVLRHPHLLSWVSLPFIAAWVAMIPVVRRRYLRQLEVTLSARGSLALDHEYLLDSSGRQALIRVLRSGEPRRVLIALEQLAGDESEEYGRALAALASHRDPAVRAAALAELGGRPGADPDVALRALVDADPAVRAAAARTYAILVEDEAVDALAALLADRSGDVRVAALAGLLAHGGVEGGIVGGGQLARWLASDVVRERQEAARALSGLGSAAYRPLRRLLDDPAPAVRRAALKAAPGVADPRLVPTLVALLGDPAARRRAGRALVAVGEPAVPTLCAQLTRHGAPRQVKLLIPRLLRRIPSRDAYRRLRALVQVEDSHLRLRICAALSHLRRSLQLPPEPVASLYDLILAEVRETYGNLAGWERARQFYATPLLEEVFTFRRDRAVRRVLRLLELRYDPDALALVRDRVLGGDTALGRQANALEVLDTMLDPSLRPLVMPFLDDVPVPERLKRAGTLVPLAPSPAEFLRRHCHHPNPYVVMLALDALARRADPIGRAEGERLLDHPEPLVREGAIAAVAAADPAGAPARIRPLLADPDPSLARQAAGTLARLEHRPVPEDSMYSTVEKILFLKSAPVFEHVSGEDLAALARVAEVETYGPGEAIFREGEMGDALFVIVRGRVRIESGGQLLATLDGGESCGETAVLDEVPRNASAIAAEPAEVLRIGSEEFYEILHEQVEIAEGVIRMLTRRLREADAVIQQLRARRV
jgi:ATP/ADP translocase/HEAT repeat protein